MADYCTQDDCELRISKAVIAGLALENVPIEVPNMLVAALGSTPGNVLPGTYKYRVTFGYPSGEGAESDASIGVTVVDNAVAGRISLTGIPTSLKGGTARRIYRTQAGGSKFYLLATISDNTTTTYTDNTADAGLGGTSQYYSVVVDAIGHITAIINGKCGEVYPVPFDPVPSIINKICTELTIVHLMERRPTTFDTPAKWQQIQKDGMDTLQKIADLQYWIDDVTPVKSKEAKVEAPDEAFDFWNTDSRMAHF